MVQADLHYSLSVEQQPEGISLLSHSLQGPRRGHSAAKAGQLLPWHTL